MIYITGDTHGDVRRFRTSSFPEQVDMTKDDFVIILGDFGLIWNKDKESEDEKYWLDWLESKNFTTLFIDGNHENYDRLNEYPKEEWNGGIVQKIRPSVIHLCRGEIFKLPVYDRYVKVLAMGGAKSHDVDDGILEIGDPLIKKWQHDNSKIFRVNHLSWWKEEIPNEKERENLWDNLESCHYNVDFVLTHEAPSSDVCFMDNIIYESDEYSRWLESVRVITDYRKWFFGHYHQDRAVNDKEICLFEQIIQIA